MLLFACSMLEGVVCWPLPEQNQLKPPILISIRDCKHRFLFAEPSGNQERIVGTLLIPNAAKPQPISNS